MKFTFENLDVYIKAVKFASEMNSLCQNLNGKISCSTIDQLLRASLSVSLNIAEGNGRWHIKETILLDFCGSLFEIVPLLQVIRNSGHISESKYSQFYDDVRSMAKMTTNLIKSVENLKSSAPQKS